MKEVTPSPVSPSGKEAWSAFAIETYIAKISKLIKQGGKEAWSAFAIEIEICLDPRHIMLCPGGEGEMGTKEEGK